MIALLKGIDVDRWIVRVLRSIGGTWEEWEDQLTVARFFAIIKSEEEIPPLYITTYLLAVSFGVLPKPSYSGGGDKSSAITGSGFVELFGPSGSLS